MPEVNFDDPKDPNFPDYAYTCEPLVAVYDKFSKKKKIVANVFLGEWMKILKILDSGWVHTKFRGGTGYVRKEQLVRERHMEIYFIDVDQGDSILIQTPDDRRILIDGGMTSDAHSFIRNKYRLDKKDNYVDFDAIIATHSDLDHVKGLIPILNDPKIAVKRIYHNGLFPSDSDEVLGRKEGKNIYDIIHEWPPDDFQPTDLMAEFLEAARAAQKRLGTVFQRMRQLPRWKDRLDFQPEEFVFKRVDLKDKYLACFDEKNPYVQIEILWPHARGWHWNKHLPWYGDKGKTVNGNSVVVRVKHGRNRILLTGDLNEKAMDDMVKEHGKTKRSHLRADVYKAAHHGSQHFSIPFFKAVAANASVIMSGDNAYDRHGHPSAVLLGTISRYSKCDAPAVFCTELAACFRKLPDNEQKLFDQSESSIYEKAISGIVHLRSDGRQLCLGTVHGRKAPADCLANINWKWDIWNRDDH